MRDEVGIFWFGVTLTVSADQVPGYFDFVEVAISPKLGGALKVKKQGGMPGVGCLGSVQGVC